MNKDLQVGQRVLLSPDSEWTHGDTNPLDCEGTVSEIGGTSWVDVRWDNGEWNAYRPDACDLIPLD
ncbi:MAG: hypothetical protein ACRC8W_04590 [Plesiomonas shigelloides]